MSQLIYRKTEAGQIDGISMMGMGEVPLSGWNAILKRAMDVVLAVLGLIVLAPLMGLIAVLVKGSSAGPVIYRQERVGQVGRVFTMYKFRSMVVDAEAQTGPVWPTDHDPRATSIGQLLRRTSLDELPQLVNVLKGDMSLVGPRPERPYFVKQFSQDIPRYLARHRVKPGMTGWAQVNGLGKEASIEERTRYDLYYAENWSLGLDLKILLLTLWRLWVSGNRRSD